MLLVNRLLWGRLQAGDILHYAPKNMKTIKNLTEEYKIKKDDPSKWRDGACPFMSTPDKPYPCNPNCALYRSGKIPRYACPLTELTPMSWVLKGSPRKGGEKK